MRRWARPPLAWLVALRVLATAAPVAANGIDYLYIEANEGGASGGHVAIRFADQVYHFQHHSPGILRLHRDDSDAFIYRYAMLENRTIHVSRINVSADTYAQLRQRFVERYFTERKQFDVLAGLHDDRTLLEALQAHRHAGTDQSIAAAAIPLRGVGFFFPDGGSPASATLPGGRSPVLFALRERVAQAYGADFIRRRTDALYRTLTALQPEAGSDLTVTEDAYPNARYPFSARYKDLLTGLLALRALDAAPTLQRGASITPVTDDFVLDETELAGLRTFSARLADQLVRLLGSERPDWGFPLLVGMARLVALEHTQQLGRFVFLDAFPPDAQVLGPSVVAQRREVIPDLLGEARTQFAAARQPLTGGAALREEDFTALEAAGNRLVELDHAAVEARPLRVAAEHLLPARPARWTDLVLPDLDAADLARSLTAARVREDAYAAALERMYAYRLVTHNCVSELFRTINTSFAAAAPARDAIPKVSTAALGGYLDTAWSLNFIPFISAVAVDHSYDVAGVDELLSYRRLRVEEMSRRENPLVAYLRESNTVTSTVYRRDPDDSFFVFFTDDSLAPRPIFGAFNFMAGLGASVVGLIQAPLDRGHALSAGLRGMLFSLPELAFVNLRKGSFGFVRRQQPIPLDPSASTADRSTDELRS